MLGSTTSGSAGPGEDSVRRHVAHLLPPPLRPRRLSDPQPAASVPSDRVWEASAAIWCARCLVTLRSSAIYTKAHQRRQRCHVNDLRGPKLPRHGGSVREAGRTGVLSHRPGSEEVDEKVARGSASAITAASAATSIRLGARERGSSRVTTGSVPGDEPSDPALGDPSLSRPQVAQAGLYGRPGTNSSHSSGVKVRLAIAQARCFQDS
jgi:hypothetical protein